MIVKDGKFPIDRGIVPVNLLSTIWRYSSLGRLPKDEGNVPVSSLKLRYKCCNLVFPEKVGKPPVKLFELRSTTTRLLRSSMDSGIVPLREQPLQVKEARALHCFQLSQVVAQKNGSRQATTL